MADILSQVKTASQLYDEQKNNYLKTGCSSIDKCLKGGIPCNSITEIVGEASAGKTQLAIQVAINAILPVKEYGLNGKALYIETESSFPYTRLTDMASAFCKKHPRYSVNDITENIYIQSLRSFDELVSLMDTLESKVKLPGADAIRLVIIDSMASLFRAEISLNYIRRAEVFRTLYMKMNHYCQTLNMTFLITNQITSYYTNESDLVSKRMGNPVIPSLGPTITQFTHNRYMLCRRNETYPAISIANLDDYILIAGDNETKIPPNQIRDFYILFSPIMGCRRTVFTVKVEGVVPLSFVY